MEIILYGIVVGTLIVYGCLLFAAFWGEDESNEPQQDKEIKFEDLEEGQCFWSIEPYYNDLTVMRKWWGMAQSVSNDDLYSPNEFKVIELIPYPKGYENPYKDLH